MYSCWWKESSVCNNNNLIHQINHLTFAIITFCIQFFFVRLRIAGWLIFFNVHRKYALLCVSSRVCQAYFVYIWYLFIYSSRFLSSSSSSFSLFPTTNNKIRDKICAADIFHYIIIRLKHVFFYGMILETWIRYTSSADAI